MPLFAVSIGGLAICAGVAIDYGRWQMQATELQSVADSASLAASHEIQKSNWTIKSVQDTVDDYVYPNAGGLENITVAPVKVDAAANQISVSLSMPGERSFTAIFMVQDPVISVGATVELGAERGMPICVFALDPTMSKAVEGSGGTVWEANDCSVQVNSKNPKAVNLSGGSSITSEENCFVGGVDQGLANVDPAPTPDCKAKPDPFANLQKPDTSGACDHNSFSADDPVTLSPGLYCGGLVLRNDVFNFEPGLYVIKDGAFVTSGGATLIGDGVTFFLTGSDAGLTWSGGGNYRLKAMSTGSLAGFVVYLDPNADRLAKSVVSGGGDTVYEGAMYFPNQKLELSGSSTASTPSPFTAFVANNFLFSGGSQLSINIDPDNTTVPIPAGLYGAAKSPRLVN